MVHPAARFVQLPGSETEPHPYTMKVTISALIIGLALALACIVTGGKTPAGAIRTAADESRTALEQAQALIP